MVRRGGIIGVYSYGYPFLVLKIDTKDFSSVEKAIEPLIGKDLSTTELWSTLERIDMNRELRVGTCFSPDQLDNFGAWSAYSWPFRSFVAEVGDRRYIVLPWTRENMERFWAYKGLAVVALQWGRISERTGMPVESKGIAFLIEVPYKPRSICIFEKVSDTEVKAITANPKAIRLLLGYGWTKVNDYTLRKRFPSRVDMARELHELDEKLQLQGIKTLMLPKGFREEIRELATIKT